MILANRREAPDRAALRTSAVTLGLAELRQGVWMRPDNLDWDRRIGTPTGDAYAVVDAQCAWMTVTPAGDGPELARQLWDLDSWASEATRLITEMRRTRRSLDRGGFDAIPRAFVTSAAVLRLFRGDPLLPAALLPAPWPGDALRDDVPRLRRGAADAAASVLHADARPPFRAGRTRTHPVSARASIGRCVRRAYRITWSARMSRVDRLGGGQDDGGCARIAEQVAKHTGEGGMEVHGCGHGHMVQGGWDIQSGGVPADG